MLKVRKQFILSPRKIKVAKRILGAVTDTETVNEALDIVIAGADIADIHKKVAGRCDLKDMDQSKFNA